MFIRRHPALGLFAPVIVLVCSGVGCPIQFGPLTGAGSTSQTASGPTEILLRIINRSGVDAEVSAVFYIGSSPVRETTRFLPARGVQSTSLVVPTMTGLIHIVAREAAAGPSAARAGDTLADEELTIAPDVLPGDSITFIIHASILADCNSNGIDDAEDIMAGTSADCNVNGLLDECESPTPVVVVIGEIRRILQSDQDGTAPSTLLDFGSYGLGSLRKLDVDPYGAHIYFTQTITVSDGTVDRIPLAGGTPAALISTQDTIGGIGLDLVGGKIYWTSHLASPLGIRIGSALLDGTDVSDVVTALQSTVAKPCVDSLNGKLYYTSNPSAGPYDFIDRADLDGTNIVDIITNATDPRDVEVWPEVNLLVWAEYGPSGGVFTADLHGNNPTKIALVTNATGVAIDRFNCQIYWTGEGSFGLSDGFIERASLDGSRVQRILSGLDAPQDVAVYSER
jgi:hypothetical protein